MPSARRWLFRVIVTASLWSVTQCTSAYADDFETVVEKLPDTGRCSYFKEEFSGIESESNRAGVSKWLGSIMSEGTEGNECREVKKDRAKIEANDARNLSGVSRYARERVYAWAGVCAVDLCDSGSSSSGSAEAEEGGVTAPDTGTSGGSSAGVVSETPPPGVKWGTIKFCNKSTDKIFLAVAYGFGHQKRKKGWYGIEPQECKSFTPEAVGINYFAHGVGWMTSQGPGGLPYCTQKAPFDEIVPHDYESDCEPGWTRRLFIHALVPLEQTTTLNITP